MRIASWNINSVRIRLPLIKRLAEIAAPDILCLQETKADNAHFPAEALQDMGYRYLEFSGEKSYNGVAILSKLPLTGRQVMPMVQGSTHCRHISAVLTGGIELHNFYVPAGGDVPDPEENPAYGFKLTFVEEMTQWSKRQSAGKRVILGDFNIAPYEHDVWSSRQLRNVVSHTEPEITRLMALRDSADWCDVGRHFVDMQEKLYSWWSYRNRDWKQSNRGRRLDHIWVSPELKTALKGFQILSEARDWESPSDHVPVLLDLA
jgi:exodeoxyribonuclease-3